MDKEVKVYLFDGSILRGIIISQKIKVRKSWRKKIFLKTSELKNVSKSTFGFSRKKASVELLDGSVFVGKLLGSIELKCSDNEVVKICCKEIFAVKSKKEE